ncbi:MAG TPA: chemotaxis response regulator protein-glutamate methylesterase [Nitrospiraceae bacterium]|nr:MAG: chemotaxis response regulator protein-glutamate methylesterase [Nitrospirae bacterium GWA2_46_11]OGW24377.1 MAG: chemotaxis response regulator protein-glutamate methylesterase [Nitrospirae bacterium GWB2_47_37]HAK88375.1 chemotaxis response regulator protein-glutamate methylesterase [Nitrospiraceae bacterium]HCZ11717.1 chemotaxis response regulator protein-glutamate methylesterase [Nitrospiraceae bacterium]
MADNKIKVLIIDDSAVIRHLLTEILGSAGDIEVIGTAQDPIFAVNKIRSLRPDVITLDVEMPRMDGLTFLEELMRTDPIPVLMVSSLTQRGCETTLKALELGAVDYVSKPAIDVSTGIAGLSDEIIRKVRIAARAKARRVMSYELGVRSKPQNIAAGDEKISELQTQGSKLQTTTDRIIAIGASTGGTQAITEIVTAMPESTPGIVIVQHMPPMFTRSFADRLNTMSRLDIKEAQTGDRILRGTALIAPGDKHMTVKRNGAMYYVDISDGPMVNFVRPSVDVLFRSVAKCAGKNAVGVILTGMGEDGARGLREMKEAGAFTVAQDEASSIVFGMPKRAIEMGAADKVLPLDNIAEAVVKSAS